MRNKDLEKQQRIKAAMIRLILREGIDGASVSKIAREASVSPATIYVYYESKEAMLTEVFREYSRRSYSYLMKRVRPDMRGGEFIEAIVRGYFAFSVEHREIFSFVEQCSRCPTLAETVCEEECSCDIFEQIHSYQRKGELKPYGDLNVGAVLFAPVKFIAMNTSLSVNEVNDRIDELVDMLKSMLLN